MAEPRRISRFILRQFLPLSYLTLGLFAAVLAADAAAATDDPANVIAYRQKVMSGIGSHIGAIVAVLRGEVSYAGHLAGHARAMHDASIMLADIFPPGSGVGETRAKPEIWQNWTKFESGIKAFQTASAKLVEAAESGDMDAVGAALGGVGDSCGECHKPFRKPKG